MCLQANRLCEWLEERETRHKWKHIKEKHSSKQKHKRIKTQKQGGMQAKI